MAFGKFRFSKRRKAYVSRRGRKKRTVVHRPFGSKGHMMVKLKGGRFDMNQRNDDNFYGLKFKLYNCANYENYCKIFDKYKIVKIQCSFRPMYRANSIAFDGGSQTGQRMAIPLLYAAVDTTDNDLPGDLRELRGYQNCRVYSDDKVGWISWRPKVLEFQFDGDPESPVPAGSRTSWISCINPNINHFGLKTCVTGYVNEEHPDLIGQTWQMDWTATVLFKDTCVYNTGDIASIESWLGHDSPEDGSHGPGPDPSTTTPPTTEPPTTTP